MELRSRGMGTDCALWFTASILHPDLKTLPNQTQVQLIGNGKIYNPAITQGLALPVQLKHPSHESFHKTVVAEEERAAGVTRFYRWHVRIFISIPLLVEGINSDCELVRSMPRSTI